MNLFGVKKEWLTGGSELVSQLDKLLPLKLAELQRELENSSEKDETSSSEE